jgi:hypothetical protein
MEAISSDRAPKAIGPYSQAVRVGNMLFLSGQIPLDPKTGEMVTTGIEKETERVLDNLAAVLPERALASRSTPSRSSSSRERPKRDVKLARELPGDSIAHRARIDADDGHDLAQARRHEDLGGCDQIRWRDAAGLARHAPLTSQSHDQSARDPLQ